jgi:hypothetical protein
VRRGEDGDEELQGDEGDEKGEHDNQKPTGVGLRGKGFGPLRERVEVKRGDTRFEFHS